MSSKILIRLCFSLRSCCLGILDSMRWLFSGILAIYAIFVMTDALIYCGDGINLAGENHKLLGLLYYFQRLPLGTAVGIVGWAMLLLSKLLRTPGGWKQCTWRQFVLSCFKWGSIDSLDHLSETTRRIDLETRIRQENLFKKLSKEQEEAIERASKSAEGAVAYRLLIEANRQGKPRHCYLAALVVVVAGMAVDGVTRSQEQTSIARGHIISAKQCAILASAASNTTLHPPPVISSFEQIHPHSEDWQIPAGLYWEILLLFETILRPQWRYLRIIPDPPSLPIDHIPKPSVQLQQLIVA
jgi:hypothetical protein